MAPAAKGGIAEMLPADSVISSIHHPAELAADAATPYPAAPDFPLFRGQNRPLYAYLQKHVAHCPASIVPPALPGERWWRQPPKGVPPERQHTNWRPQSAHLHLPFTQLFPPTGIYHHFPYLLFLPRSFASLRMTVGGGKRKSGQQIAVGVPLSHCPTVSLSHCPTVPLSHCPPIPPVH